jgi:hypothetical protein
MSTLRGGLLTEGARTNQVFHSNTPSDASWVVSNVTFDSSSAVGLLNIGTFTTSGTGAGARVRLGGDNAVGVDPAGQAAVAFSWVYRGRAGQFIRFGRRSAAVTTNVSVTFSADSGTITDASGTGLLASYSERLSVNLWRITVVVDYSGQAAQSAGYGVSIADAGVGGSTITGTLDIGARQVEFARTSSSFIVTGATAVTRATDQVSYANFPQPAEIAARGGITVYHRHVEQGTRDTASGRYWQVGAGADLDTTRTLRLIQGSGLTNTQLGLGNGVDTGIIRELARPAIGDLVETVAQIEYVSASTAFRLNLIRSINGAAPVAVGVSGTIAGAGLISSGWATAATLHIGSSDGGNNPGFQLNQVIAARFGINDLATMRALV